jgi:TolA-binding protein
MTECNGGPVEEFGALYITGQLSDEEAARFEDHYFACDQCHELLLVLRQIQEGLQEQVTSAARLESATPPQQPLRIVSRRPEASSSGVLLRKPSLRVAVWGSIAAAMLLASVLTLVKFQNGSLIHLEDNTSKAASPNPVPPDPVKPKTKVGKQPAPSSDQQIASLADLQLPVYQPESLRGSDSSSQQHSALTNGLKSYAGGDCNTALNQFKQIIDTLPDKNPDTIAANFYSGLCRLKSHDLLTAQSHFEKTIAAGDSPQLEAAEYFLAQTLILKSDATSARNWLRKTISLHGDYQQRAEAQLTRLVHIAHQPWNLR